MSSNVNSRKFKNFSTLLKYLKKLSSSSCQFVSDLRDFIDCDGRQFDGSIGKATHPTRPNGSSL